MVFIAKDNIDLDKALSAIAKELERNRDNWEAWAAKADILCSMGLYENAILCCNRSLAINPDNSFTEATKANALNKLKMQRETIANHSNLMFCVGIGILCNFDVVSFLSTITT